MAQNRSTAVMNRRVEPHDSLDDFPTPPWATRALCERLPGPLRTMACRDPAAGRGHMARPLLESFGRLEAADVHDYGAGRDARWAGGGCDVRDYLFGPDPEPVEWTITNPPFRLAQQFVERALRTSTIGVAVIVRTAFLEGVGRHRELFGPRPPSQVLQFVERVPMHRGRLTATGSTATAYCWLVWTVGERGTRFDWISPCRRRLERPGDYE